MLEQYLDKLFASFSVNTITTQLTMRFDELLLISPSRELITPVINNKLAKIADEISRHDLK